MSTTNTNYYKYFAVHKWLIVQSLLSNEKKPDIYNLGIADWVKGLLVLCGLTRKIHNTSVSDLAQALQIDYYVALIIYNSAREQKRKSTDFFAGLNPKLKCYSYLYCHKIPSKCDRFKINMPIWFRLYSVTVFFFYSINYFKRRTI